MERICRNYAVLQKKFSSYGEQGLLFSRETGISMPLGSGIFRQSDGTDNFMGEYNYHPTRDQLAFAVALSDTPFAQDLARTDGNDSRFQNPGQWRGKLEGISILELGSGPVLTFARVARYMGAKVTTLDAEKYTFRCDDVPAWLHRPDLAEEFGECIIPAVGIPVLQYRRSSPEGEFQKRKLDFVLRRPHQVEEIPLEYQTEAFYLSERQQHVSLDLRSSRDVIAEQMIRVLCSTAERNSPIDLPQYNLIVAAALNISPIPASASHLGTIDTPLDEDLLDKALPLLLDGGIFQDPGSDIWIRRGDEAIKLTQFSEYISSGSERQQTKIIPYPIVGRS